MGYMDYDVPVPNRGWGHNHCTSSTKIPRRSLGVTDNEYRQIYRMYHIYDRNLYICIVPSIVNVALLGEFVFPLVSSVHLHYSIAIS